MESKNKKIKDATYTRRTAIRLRPREGRPAVTSRASERCKYAAGKKMMPIHCNRNNSSVPQLGIVLLCKASVVKTTTTHNKIIANERATRSRKLNDRAYRNNENAVMAMPAVKILLIVCSPASKPSIQPLNMQTFQ